MQRRCAELGFCLHVPFSASPHSAVPQPTLLHLQPGLTTVQSLLFFEAAAHHWLAVPTIFMAIVPVVFLFCNSASPLVVSAEAWSGGERCPCPPMLCGLHTRSLECCSFLLPPIVQAAHIWEFVAFFGVW